MIRQTSFAIIIAAAIALSGLTAVQQAYASEHQWTSLDGPYWANSIDVAYGASGGNQSWNRYLIGSDQNTTKLFRWKETDSKWFEWDELPTANKLISYKNSGSGNVAVCSAYDDDIWRTNNGGVQWINLQFPSNFNRHFSSVEILNSEFSPGNTIIVASSLQSGLASVNYTSNGGANWNKFGATNDPLDLYNVSDMEATDYSGYTAATSNGIYFHTNGDWNSVWQQKAFPNSQVTALENVDLWHAQQVAAVVEQSGRKLYYTPTEGSDDPWDHHSEIKINNQSFDKEVKDLAAVYLGVGQISCFVATTEGVYLLHFNSDNPGNAQLFDIKSYYQPMQYDHLTNAVDYYYYVDAQYEYASVITSTPYNIYEILTTYSNEEVYNIEVSEIVTGTYKCDIIAPSFPENASPLKSIFGCSVGS